MSEKEKSNGLSIAMDSYYDIKALRAAASQPMSPIKAAPTSTPIAQSVTPPLQKQPSVVFSVFTKRK